VILSCRAFRFSPRNGAAFGLWISWGHCRKSSSVTGTYVKTNASLALYYRTFSFLFLFSASDASPFQTKSCSLLHHAGSARETTGLTLSAFPTLQQPRLINSSGIMSPQKPSGMEIPSRCQGSRTSTWISQPQLLVGSDPALTLFLACNPPEYFGVSDR
jgi:hypothetical protein